MSTAPENPYQSPRETESAAQPSSSKRSRPWLIFAAIAWAILLGPCSSPGYSPGGLVLYASRGEFVVLPLRAFQIVSTVVTIAVLAGLARSVAGWRHVLVVPLWIILMGLQCLVWLLPYILRH